MTSLDVQAGKASIQSGMRAVSPKDEVSKTAEEFESMFLGLVVREMLKNTQAEPSGDAHAEQMFQGMLADELGASIAKSGGVGIAKTMEQAMRAYGR